MTSKEKVLSVYPDASVWVEMGTSIWKVFDGPSTIGVVLGVGSSPASAWDDAAASKLPSAPSPAAMETLCACGHKKGMHWHRVMGAVECGECGCRQFALPEPVSTEEAAKDALRRLAAEVRGWLGLRPNSLAAIFGNTNVAVMRDRLALAESALAKPSAEGDGTASIFKWANEAFGPLAPGEAGTLRMVNRTNEEMEELLALTNGVCRYEEIAEEVADVVICLHRLLGHIGMDLDEWVSRKMAINRSRTWEKDGAGCGYHATPSGQGEKR